MNDEIKEILNYLAFLEDIDTQKKVKKVADYITNLQEKYDKALTDLVHESHKRIELENKTTNLEQKYQDAINQSIEDHKYASKKEDEALDYKSRIEKADWWLKEMLKQAKSDETRAIINGALDLLLNGRSDE